MIKFSESALLYREKAFIRTIMAPNSDNSAVKLGMMRAEAAAPVLPFDVLPSDLSLPPCPFDVART